VTRSRLALGLAGIALGLAAEWASYDTLDLALGDLLAGWALLGCGVAAWELRRESRTGPVMAWAGVAWFLGSFSGSLLYIHRGPLVHLLLSYPRGRLSSRLQIGVVLAAYVDGAVPVIAKNDELTIALAAIVVAVALWRYLSATGAERRACASALAATSAIGLVLALGAAARLADAGQDPAVLWAYEVAIALSAIGLFADLVWGRWTQAVLTGLVVDLGELSEVGTLRDRLARALGDHSLVVGYWLDDAGAYVDDSGRPVHLPVEGSGRAVTTIEQGGERVAALVHDPAILGDPGLLRSVSAATRVALANVRLQAEARARVIELEASRRRIVEASDSQRLRIERELREGAERRLAAVTELLATCGSDAAEVKNELDVARAELRAFAHGIHPAVLAEKGLPAALADLVERTPVPIDLEAPEGRLPDAIEIAAYFLCSEGLANVAKYAHASRVRISVKTVGDHLVVEVADDGVGGADPSRGSGLRGLADRVEALGGRFGLESPPGRGTRLVAEIPFS
jgi:signal transduction histidine kinase